jgi:hypothetical protein
MCRDRFRLIRPPETSTETAARDAHARSIHYPASLLCLARAFYSLFSISSKKYAWRKRSSLHIVALESQSQLVNQRASLSLASNATSDISNDRIQPRAKRRSEYLSRASDGVKDWFRHWFGISPTGRFLPSLHLACGISWRISCRIPNCFAFLPSFSGEKWRDSGLEKPWLMRGVARRVRR